MSLDDRERNRSREDVCEDLLDWVGIFTDHTEWRIILMMDFMELIKELNVVEQSMYDHVEKVINKHDQNYRPNQL